MIYMPAASLATGEGQAGGAPATTSAAQLDRQRSQRREEFFGLAG